MQPSGCIDPLCRTGLAIKTVCFSVGGSHLPRRGLIGWQRRAAGLQVLFTEKAAAAMTAAVETREEGAAGGNRPASNVEVLGAVVEAAVSIALVHPNIVTV